MGTVIATAIATAIVFNLIAAHCDLLRCLTVPRTISHATGAPTVTSSAIASTNTSTAAGAAGAGGATSIGEDAAISGRGGGAASAVAQQEVGYIGLHIGLYIGLYTGCSFGCSFGRRQRYNRILRSSTTKTSSRVKRPTNYNANSIHALAKKVNVGRTSSCFRGCFRGCFRDGAALGLVAEEEVQAGDAQERRVDQLELLQQHEHCALVYVLHQQPLALQLQPIHETAL